LGFDNVLGTLDSPFLQRSGGDPTNPGSNPVQSPGVNSVLVSDLVGFGGQSNVSLTNIPGVGETLNIPGSGGVSSPQNDGTPQTQNLARPET
jgi:hypothetical protein